MARLALQGDVVERQTYLNGSIQLQIEGEAVLGAMKVGWSLGVTLPKADSDPVREGELGLYGEVAWLGDVSEGSFAAEDDEDTGASTQTLTLRIFARAGAEHSANWQEGSLSLTVAGQEAGGTLELSP